MSVLLLRLICMNWAVAGRWVRRGVLALLVLGALIWFGGWGSPETCSQQLSQGSPTPVTVCSDMTLTDARALLFLLVIGGLLLPEVAELEVAGVLSVRKQVDEAKDEVTGLKTELAHIRAEILTAATAASHSRSKASVENYNVFPGRAADVRRAYKEIQDGGDGELDQSEQRGADAAVAFEAGFYGLTRYLTERMTPAVVVGYLFGEDDQLRLDSLVTSGEGTAGLEAAQRAASPPPTSGVFYDAHDDGYVLSAPACDDQGLTAGVLAVRVPSTSAALDELNVEDAVGAILLIAGAYARLLIDLMGEKPRDLTAGTSDDGGTQ